MSDDTSVSSEPEVKLEPVVIAGEVFTAAPAKYWLVIELEDTRGGLIFQGEPMSTQGEQSPLQSRLLTTVAETRPLRLAYPLIRWSLMLAFRSRTCSSFGWSLGVGTSLLRWAFE